MIITFCGHSTVYEKEEISNKLYLLLDKFKTEKFINFYLGGYGDFDYIAKNICKQFQLKTPNVKLFFITPYLNQKYLNNIDKDYNEIIFPDIENAPPKYMILKRNYWMVEKADIVISYINYSWGGAYKTLKYAHKVNKKCINLGSIRF